MARTTGNVIADSLQLSLGYAERLLKGISAERFARLSVPGGVVVDSNHPAFILGHLCLYSPRMLTQFGADASAIQPAEQIVTACSKDATCQDDPEGTIYPAMNVICETFFNGHQQVMALLREVPEELLQQPNPSGGRMTELFPTLGSLDAFYCGGHIMMHLGQLSAWRRMEGLPPA